MKIEERTFDVDFDFEWDYQTPIDKIREDLDALEKLGATHINIDATMSYDCAYTSIDAVSVRLETEAECLKRETVEEHWKKTIKNRELEQLATLQKKYEL